MENMKKPQVGIGVIVMKEDKILFQKRKNSHGDGTWSFPGGHLEYLESFKKCAKREIKEETSLRIEIKKDYPVAITNDFFEKEGKHYVTLFMEANYLSGVPKISEKEKNKLEEITWFRWDNLPDNLFLPVQNLIKQGYVPPNSYLK